IPLALLFGDEACKSPNRVFADDVCGGAVIFGAAAAPEIDDISGATFLHKGDDIFRTEKGAAEVGLNYAVPEIFAHKADAGPAWNTPIDLFCLACGFFGLKSHVGMTAVTERFALRMTQSQRKMGPGEASHSM